MALDIRPLAGHLGAEVSGVDVAHLEGPGDSGAAAFDALRRAFLERHVLVLRDQKLAPEQLTAFGRRWGPLLVHPIVPHIDGHPEVIQIRNLGKQRTITEVWHSDVTFADRPPSISMLHALEMPAAGGDTLFSNQHLAFERLSEGMRRLLRGLRALHTGAGLGAVMGKGADWRTHGRLHPVVRTHPETGR
jgi:taurine dioxygenase